MAYLRLSERGCSTLRMLATARGAGQGVPCLRVSGEAVPPLATAGAGREVPFRVSGDAVPPLATAGAGQGGPCYWPRREADPGEG